MLGFIGWVWGLALAIAVAPPISTAATVGSNACIAVEELPMATLTIRNLDERTKAQLRIQAARHG